MAAMNFPRTSLPEGGVTIWHAARDGARLRQMFWPGEGKEGCGPILFAGGKRDFIERHAESLNRLTAAGHAVTALDWRDQGLSARGTVPDEELFNHMRADLSEILEGAASRAGGPMSLVMHSMGGCVALDLLSSSASARALTQRAVLFAPLLGLAGLRLPPAVVGRVADWQVRRGNARNYPPGQMPYGPGYRSDIRFARLSNDRERFDEGFLWIDAEPGLASGGATWGWLASAYKSMAKLAEAETLESIDLPIMMLLGTDERIVSPVAIHAAAKRLQHGFLKLVQGGRHELQQDSDAVQDQYWPDVMAFLAPACRR